MTCAQQPVLVRLTLPGFALLAVLCHGAHAADDDPISSVVSSIHVDPNQHAGQVSAVNGSVHIGAGAIVGPVSSVNGSIHVEDKAVTRAVSSVNGSISFGTGGSADSASTVNGSIHVGAATQIAGAVSTVNGSVHVGDGAQVKGQIATVNGSIQITNAQVGGGITSMSGSIRVSGHSRVDGGIRVIKARDNFFDWPGWFGFLWPSKPRRVVIGPGAVVNGTLRFEHEVRLYVSDRATIGSVQGANPIRFSGDQPPED